MKFVITFIAVVICSALGFGAQISWTAGGFESSFAGGVGYLIQSDSPVSAQAISDVLANGIPEESPSSYNLLTSAEVQLSNGTAYIADTDYNVPTPDRSPGGVGENSFVIVFNEGQTAFAIYVAESTDFTSGDGGITWNGIFYSTDGWLTGTVGGGETPVDPNVPEPTALALLALGVAGVALRRRVA